MIDPRVPTSVTHLSRLCWVGLVTFVIRTYEEIVRFFFLTIAPSVVTTALYFIVFGMLIGQRVGDVGGFPYKQFIAPGLLVMPVIASSYSHASLSFVVAKLYKLLDEHLISPLPSWMIVVSYVAGASLRGMLVGLSVGIVVVLFSQMPVQHPLVMVGAMLLTSVVSSLAGFINGVFAKTFDQANWISSFVMTPLTYLGGVFYSITLLPGWAQLLSRVNPIFYFVNLFRYSMLGVSDVHVVISVAAMAVASAAMFAVAAMLMKRGVGTKE